MNIRCVYLDRGCQAIVQLQHLDQHESTCVFTPAMCTNPGCGATVNQRDFYNHENELCEFRKLKCQSCGEMTKTLTDMENRLAIVETNMATNVTVETKVANVEKIVVNMERNMQKRIVDVETNLGIVERNMERRFEQVNNKVTGLKTSLIEAFNETKDVLLNMEDKIEANTRKVRNTPSGDRNNIIVAGGAWTDSVEMFNWLQRTWSSLQCLPKRRDGAASFVYNGHVTIAGGYCSGFVDDMMSMNMHFLLSWHTTAVWCIMIT